MREFVTSFGLKLLGLVHGVILLALVHNLLSFVVLSDV